MSNGSNGFTVYWTDTTSGVRVSGGGSISAAYNHTHEFTIDQNGDGVTAAGGDNSHAHLISNFILSEEVVTSDWVTLNHGTDAGETHNHVIGEEIIQGANVQSAPTPYQQASSTRTDDPSEETDTTSPERDLYGGYADIDLYGASPTEYGTLYLLKNFGTALQNNFMSINWVSTNTYSTSTSFSPVTDASPSAVSTTTDTWNLIYDYLAFPVDTHSGLIIGRSTGYSSYDDRASGDWETDSLDDKTYIYGLIDLRASQGPAGYLAVDAGSVDPTSTSVTPGTPIFKNGVLQFPSAMWGTPSDGYVWTLGGNAAPGFWIEYAIDAEVTYLTNKFGFFFPTRQSSDFGWTIDFEIDYLASQIVTDEVPNQVLNNVVDYGDIKESELTSIATSEREQTAAASEEFTTSTSGYTG